MCDGFGSVQTGNKAQLAVGIERFPGERRPRSLERDRCIDEREQIIPNEEGVAARAICAHQSVTFSTSQQHHRSDGSAIIQVRRMRACPLEIFTVGNRQRLQIAKNTVVLADDYIREHGVDALPYPEIIAVDIDTKQSNLATAKPDAVMSELMLSRSMKLETAVKS